MKEHNSWEDFKDGREDLYMIPEMKKGGWSVEFVYRDVLHGRTTPEKHPTYAPHFSKGVKRCWYTGQKGWAVAELINGYYRNHRYYKTLQEVLENE